MGFVRNLWRISDTTERHAIQYLPSTESEEKAMLRLSLPNVRKLR
jgi:hypothetical protein